MKISSAVDVGPACSNPCREQLLLADSQEIIISPLLHMFLCPVSRDMLQ